MHRNTPRISLALLALAASVATAQAQAPAQRPAGMTQGHGPMMGTDSDGMMRPMRGERGRMADRGMMDEHGRMGQPYEHTEGRIAFLKAELKITDAQTAPWNAFAANMRTEATAMQTMHADMQKTGMPATTPDRMAARVKMMTARVAIMQTAEASTKTLYTALSEDQRKAFDQMMSGPMGRM